MDSIRVLIVDDEVELVNALEERLMLRGFDAEGVTSGREALDLLETRVFDVVLLDVKMPGLGGLEVVRTIKARWPSLPILLLTGHGSKTSVEEGLALGAVDYLVKPVKIETLVRTLGEVAARRPLEDADGEIPE